MNYLSPEIAKMSNKVQQKSLAKKGISCGIFQDIGEDTQKHMIENKQSRL